MKRYLVGGAIRDELLGLPVRERDWVVVGAMPEELGDAGYLPVGKDFPVFLHPQTKEEHALARTERKTAPGYRGFSFHTGPEVTLEDDLVRRDLTINAIARDDDGRMVDPHGGQRDLEARLLRHVSEAFCEDPVRILRVACFHARFAALGFRVADETLALMRQMVDSGEVDHLVPERVWQETKKGLMTDSPGTYFRTLHECGALARIMPELAALHGVPQRADYHPEVDTLVHVLMCVDTSAVLQLPLEVRYAVLVHDLGKGATPQEEWPSHRMHDMRGVPLVEKFSARLRVPSACRDLALVHTKEHLIIHQALQLKPSTLLGLLERMGGFAKGERFEQVLQASVCDARGRLGFEHSHYEQADYLRAARVAANEIQAAQVMADGITGVAIGEALKERRTQRLKDWKAQQKAGQQPDSM